LGRLDAELSIRLVSDAEIAELAGGFGRARRPTDVLAFPTREGIGSEFSGPLIGDVVLSVPTAARQAAERGVSLECELIVLLTHGVLHLLGMDHEEKTDWQVMRSLEAHVAWALQQIEPPGSTSAGVRGPGQ